MLGFLAKVTPCGLPLPSGSAMYILYLCPGHCLFEDTQNTMDSKKKKHRNPKRAKSGPGLIIDQHQSKETIILRPPKKTRLPRKAHIGGKVEGKRRKDRPTRRWTESIKEWLQMSPTEAGREAQKREVFRRMVREATSTQTCQDE